MEKRRINIVGGGLAGSEAAWQISRYGVPVRLFEMKPQKKSPAHTAEGFAELVCSNSLRSDRLSNAAGLLKEELRRMNSLVMRAADETRVPAGGALAVDRNAFSEFITRELEQTAPVEIIRREVRGMEEFSPDEDVIVAAGPLCSEDLANSIRRLTGTDSLHFFDAAAPIVDADSVDMKHAFLASRYGRGSDYVNCPMTREEYEIFYRELVAAEEAPIREFEPDSVFEGCMPIETMAKRGYETMLFGPLKPKGLQDPKTGREPYAVVQLRKEDAEGSMYNLVGFQTHLKFPEQRRVFGLIPALKQAEFLRYGVMHKNTFLNAPQLLDRYFRLRSRPTIRFAGQITGVEGYIESAGSGLLCGLFTALEALRRELPDFTDGTALGALSRHVSQSTSRDYQPMNINFGLMRPLGERIRKKEEKNEKISARALAEIGEIRTQYGLL